jgi:cytochrome c
MDFLKDIALPQPLEHFQLLLFIMNLLLILFLPSLGFAVGSAVFAVRNSLRRNGSHVEEQFARDLMHTPIFSGGGVAFLLVLPALALVFLLIQFLQGTPAIAPGLMAFGFFTLVAAVALLKTFRHNLDLKQVLETSPAAAPGVDHLRKSNAIALVRTGRWGLLFLVVASALCLGAISIAVDRSSWTDVDSVFGLLLSADFWVRYAHFLVVASAATGIGTLFFLLQAEADSTPKEEPYITSVRSFAFRLIVPSLLAQPLLMIASVALLPGPALSGFVYGLAGISLAFLLATAVLLYAYSRDGRTGFVQGAFITFALALFLVFSKDQIAVRNATADRAASLAIAADRELEALKVKLGVAATVMSGQEIYTARCSACHLFDEKKIGPPYREVIPKYGGRKGSLVAFILNPVKVNPAYPNMPNQGLKPVEADSIASFLLAKFAASPTPPTTPSEAKKP